MLNNTVLIEEKEKWSDKEVSADVFTGILPVEKGGTGATTVEQALQNLGAALSDHSHNASDITSGILSVARGGTGVSSISALLTALGLDSTAKVVVGSYTGDNSTKRLISLDFTPNVVIIIGGTKYSSSNEYTKAQMCFKTSSISHVIGFTLKSNAGASYTRAGCNTNCLCVTNGFYVGTNDNAWSTTTTSGKETESTNYKHSYQAAYTYIAIG